MASHLAWQGSLRLGPSSKDFNQSNPAITNSDRQPSKTTVARRVAPSLIPVKRSTRKGPPVKRLPSMISFPEPVDRISLQKRFSLTADFEYPHCLEFPNCLEYPNCLSELSEDDQKLVHKWHRRIQDDEISVQEWLKDNLVCCKRSKIGFCYCGRKSTIPMPHLPSELLHEIFDRTVPPDYLLDPSIVCGPNSPWCSSMVAKRSLILVSRAWYEAGVDLLYRNVFIRRVPAAEALLATLTANPSLGALIRNITVMCYVPRNCRATTRHNLTQILKFCPALTSLNHLPPFLPPTPFFLPALPSTITSLKFSSHEDLSAVYDILRCFCPRLEELSLYPKDDTVFDALELTFPRLHALYLTLAGGVAQKFGMKWDLPMLRRLTFRTEGRVKGDLLSAYRNLVASHGHRLKYVAFPSLFSTKGEFGPLLAKCPIVEHVVLPANTEDLCRPNYCFPSVKWVDIWCHGPGRPRRNDPKKSPCYPNIERPFRFLDYGLTALMEDVPQAFDPRARGNWSLDFSGISIRQEEHDDYIVLVSTDLEASDEWHLSYFGAIEVRPMDREEEVWEALQDSSDISAEEDGWCSDDDSDGDSDDSWFSLESDDLSDEFYDGP